MNRKTMTLNLTPEEMRVLKELADKKDLSMTSVIRQALRLYQLVDARQERGETIRFANELTKKNTEFTLL